MKKIKFETKLVSNLKEHQLASLKGGAIAMKEASASKETDSVNTKFTKIAKCCK